MLGIDAGSTIRSCEIVIGHGIHVRLFSLSRLGLSRIGRGFVCCLSGYPKKNVSARHSANVGGFAIRAGEGSVPAGATKYVLLLV